MADYLEQGYVAYTCGVHIEDPAAAAYSGNIHGDEVLNMMNNVMISKRGTTSLRLFEPAVTHSVR